MAQTFIIAGSYGIVTVDSEGMAIKGVRGPNHDQEGIPDEYADIVRYDVAEYRDWLKEKTPHDPNAEVLHVDCVDIGFWYIEKDTKEKKYCPAEEDSRNGIHHDCAACDEHNKKAAE